jgi:iron complex outermembrane receptor protein
MMDVFGTPQVLQDQEVSNDATVLSTELRIDNSASDSRLHWLAGIYLADDKEDRYEGNYGFPARGNSGGRIGPQAESYWITTSTADTTSLGVFGELSFDISERFNLTVGGRYSEDKRDYLFSNVCSGRAGACTSFGQVDPVYGGNPAYDCRQNIVNGICGTQANPMGIVIPLEVSDSWDDFSAKVSLSYALNDNQNIYALYSEGFKAGGFQHDARNAKALLGVIVQPENATNYELGWKGSYDTVRFAVTVFQMEQKNAQATALIPVGSTFTTSVINYGGVEQKGIEVEATWLVAEHLLFGGSLGLYDGKLGPGSVTGAGFDDATGQVTGRDVSGQATGLDSTYVLYGEYDIDLSGGSNIKFRADIQHRSIIPAAANRTGVLTLDGSREAFARPAISNVGASLTWTSEDGGMAFSLWGKNLLDQYDWKNIGPAIGFHYNNGGSGPGSAPRGYSGRMQIGLDGRFRF